MINLFFRAAPYLLIGMLFVITTLQRQTLRTQDDQIAVLNDIIVSRGQQLDLIATAIMQQREAMAELSAQQEKFRDDLAARRFDFERLKNENAEVRRWADAQLPADIVRLRSRPAITGADAYHQHLRARDTVPTTGQPSPQ